MLYRLLQIFTNIFYRVFYKFEYRGLDNIPKDKPVVLAPNHVNGFIDPVITAMLFKRKVRFFARGDVFKSKFAKWVLNQMNISPMYRIQEGYGEVKKNDKTFEECKTLLTNNKTILLFPEAICVQEKRLRPLKKGLARIVFQTEESFNFSKDVLIVPIGLNYSDAKRFRSKLYIDYGVPVSIKDYEQRFKQDKVKAINEFTKDFESKMAEQMIIINNKDNDKVVEGLEEIYLCEWILQKGRNPKKRVEQYMATRQIADMVNKLENSNNSLIISWRETITKYMELLNSNGLRDHLLRPEKIAGMNVGTFLMEYLIIYLGMPIYFIGLVMNYPPYYFAKRTCDKKVKHAEFVASIYMNLTMILWPIYFGVQLLIIALVFRNWSVLAVYAMSVIVSALFVLQFYEVKQRIFGRWRLLRLVRKQKQTVVELVNTRAQIIEEVEAERKNYFASLK